MISITKFNYLGYDVTKELPVYCDESDDKSSGPVKMGIVLDSIQFKSEENIQSFILEQMHKGIKNGRFYNYFIDKFGKIYQLLDDKTTGNVCTFDVYSLEASKTFGKYCPVTDAKFSPRTKFPDQILKSVLVEYEDGYMTEISKQNLKKLCIFLIKKTNLKFTTMGKNDCVTNQNIYLRRMFPGTEAEKTYSGIGDIFKDTVDFMVFKKSLYNDSMTPMDETDNELIMNESIIEEIEIR